MGIERKWRTLAHREQAGDRVDLAIGQDHAGNRTVAELTILGMQLRRGSELLAQIGRGVDEKPVRAVAAHRDRGLRAPEVWLLASRRPANRTSAIPLRYAAAGCGAQDDDAEHERVPRPYRLKPCVAPPCKDGPLEIGPRKRGPKNVSRWTPGQAHSHIRERARPGDPPASKRESDRFRLLAGGARIHIDFHADRHFDDLRCFPGH